MSEPYLIAHLVRGEPAFDIAQQIECPHCHDANSCGDYEGPTCNECHGAGFWWIIPTSGHRAYPYWAASLQDIDDTYDLHLNRETFNLEGPPHVPDPPPPDHYANQPAARGTGITDLSFLKPKLLVITRRL